MDKIDALKELLAPFILDYGLDFIGLPRPVQRLLKDVYKKVDESLPDEWKGKKENDKSGGNAKDKKDTNSDSTDYCRNCSTSDYITQDGIRGFRGNDGYSFGSWVSDVDSLSDRKGYSPIQKILFAALTLEGPARRSVMEDMTPQTWEELQTFLKKMYDSGKHRPGVEKPERGKPGNPEESPEYR